jgi:3-oxoacyl-[acyl-carrier protein] reductase
MMNEQLKKVALITGASRGVGQAIGIALAIRGHDVAINHRDSAAQAADTVAQIQALGAQAIAIQADTSDDEACRRMVEETTAKFGRLDILINNAATTQFIPHDQMDVITTELWDRIFAVNVRGPFQCVRAAQAHLEASGAGHVINITSIAGINGNGSSIPYCASKAAMINMTQSLARTLAPKVRVNSIAPGFIDSQWTHAGLGDAYDGAAERQRSGAALGQIAQPEDVADAVMSLLEGSKLVTGQTLVVDGGALLGAKP